MDIVIFTGGNVQKGFFVTEALQSADKIFAADCGANSALELEIFPSVVLGDFDSLDIKTKNVLEKKGTKFVPYPKEKNQTDTELAVEYALQQGATTISIVGGVEGGRLDHVLGNVLLTEGHQSLKVYFITGNQKMWVVRSPVTQNIQGKKEDLLSLIPIGTDVTNISTSGLQYALKNETLFFGKTRGISNVFEKREISVTFEKGLLLFVHTTK